MDHLVDGLRSLARHYPGLRLLLLHGSRARGDAHSGSDWDFAFLANEGFDADALLAALSERLSADRIDLADLSRASVLLRHAAAGDGIVLYESTPGAFHQFQIEALTAWSDLEPVLRPESEAALARLHP